jgi:hypothetical protein
MMVTMMTMMMTMMTMMTMMMMMTTMMMTTMMLTLCDVLHDDALAGELDDLEVVLAGVEQVLQLLAVDLHERHLDRELHLGRRLMGQTRERESVCERERATANRKVECGGRSSSVRLSHQKWRVRIYEGAMYCPSPLLMPRSVMWHQVKC